MKTINYLLVLLLSLVVTNGIAQTDTLENPRVSYLKLSIEKIEKENETLLSIRENYHRQIDSLQQLKLALPDVSDSLQLSYLELEHKRLLQSNEQLRASMKTLIYLIDALNEEE